jgi:cytochrome P450
MATTAAELGALAFFQGCSDADLTGLETAVTGARHVVAGDVICSEGDTADRWWIVVDGLADVTTRGLFVGTIGPGETIGELALLDGEPRNATVTAATDMELREVSGGDFVGALLDNPSLSLALLRQLAMRLRLADEAPLRQSRPPRIMSKPMIDPGAARSTELDPFAPGYFDDPYPYFAALRDHAPVHWSERLDSFVVTRYDDVHRLIRDRTMLGSVTTNDPLATLLGQPAPKAQRRRVDKMMIRRDGEDHTRLRRLVSKVFTPRALQQWKERAETVVDRLLDEAADKGKIDVMQEYALQLPVTIISEMLGMPLNDLPQLRNWSRALTKGLDPFISEEDEEAAVAAGTAMFAYIEAVVADKRSHLSGDILSALIEAEEQGDRLDVEEVQAQVMLLYIAGHETTVNLIGNGLVEMFRAPEQMDRLRVDPALAANAVEEVLRYNSPVQITRRVNQDPLEIGGVTIPRGSLITLGLASANRDPRKWGPTVDEFDIARPGANEHVSFGAGAHYCLGASLARLEGQVALPRLVRRFPHMEPAYTEPSWMPRMALHGVETLPVILH